MTFFLILKAFRQAVGPTHRPTKRVPGLQRSQFEANHSPLLSIEVRGEWMWTATLSWLAHDFASWHFIVSESCE